jgi:hypothetical protein
MAYTRIYTMNGGGMNRHVYSLQDLYNGVGLQTQFAARNIMLPEGAIDLNKATGPDDVHFVKSAILEVAKDISHIVPIQLTVYGYNFSNPTSANLVIMLRDFGMLKPAFMQQMDKHLEDAIVYGTVAKWFMNAQLRDLTAQYTAFLDAAVQRIHRLLTTIYLFRKPYDSVFARIPLKKENFPKYLNGVFLGDYETRTQISSVHKDSIEIPDIAWCEQDGDYIIVQPANPYPEWVTLKTLVGLIPSENWIDLRGTLGMPEATKGEAFLVTQSGTIGDYFDELWAGDVLICTSDNLPAQEPQEEGTYANNTKNFVVITSNDIDNKYMTDMAALNTVLDGEQPKLIFEESNITYLGYPFNGDVERVAIKRVETIGQETTIMWAEGNKIKDKDWALRETYLYNFLITSY